MKVVQAIHHNDMKRLSIFLALFCIAIIPTLSSAQSFSPTANYNVCFTPSESCTTHIVEALHKAKQTILVQAYSFTSAPIANALVESKKKGIDVKVILDKSQFNSKQYTSTTFLNHAGISIFIDAKPSIAHNKIMILDNNTVITGSFNFTKAAEEKNAENLLIIQDKGLAQRYTENWFKRQGASIPLANYHPSQQHKNRRQKIDISTLLSF